MINKDVLHEALKDYKNDFLTFEWKSEKYKWEAIKSFKDNWNIDSDNFPQMLDDSLSKAKNLLTSGHVFSRGMIVGFAWADSEYVRNMFRELFDEDKDVIDRIKKFKEQSDYALKEFTPEAAHHFQDARAISVYLWLNNPEKYYIYKYSEVRRVVDTLEYDQQVKKGELEQNFILAENLYDEMLPIVSADKELTEMYQAQLTSEVYPDLSYRTLTNDVGFYISRYFSQKGQEENSLGDRENKDVRYWLYSPGNGAEYWDEFYKKGIMGLGWDEIGDYTQYSSREEMREAMKEFIDTDKPFKNPSYATWQFLAEIKPGDIVFVKKGMYKIVGRGVVESDYYFDDSREEFKNLRDVKWTDNGEWEHPGQAAMKTLTDVTQYTDYVETLNALFETDLEDDDERNAVAYEPYEASDFLSEVYMTEDEYNSLLALVLNKKNVILQGAPGVGKTFAARRLAYSIMGEKDKSRVMMVQFHQSYSYEDFIMGFRPTENGFALKTGAFYDFCKEAEIDSENDYFFIIDEINRGNLSKIFGELFMLIETDKRGIQLRLLYSNEKFSVPKNVYIIGMMNTADRSLAMLDYALRRRFAFYEMKPGFETDGFKDYQDALDDSRFNALIECVKTLNQRIAEDDSLGEGFCIGHSYFCNLKEVTDQTLSGIVEYELIPLLKEYWFDEPSKVREWADKLRRAIK